MGEAKTCPCCAVAEKAHLECDEIYRKATGKEPNREARAKRRRAQGHDLQCPLCGREVT